MSHKPAIMSLSLLAVNLCIERHSSECGYMLCAAPTIAHFVDVMLSVLSSGFMVHAPFDKGVCTLSRIYTEWADGQL
jgi:hypothetical protein